MKKTNQIVLLIFLFFSSNLFGQNKQENPQCSHLISLKTQFSQFKDQFNYGLVFNGITLGGNYTYINISDKNTFTYSGGLAFGINFNKGIGVVLRIKPVDVFYGYILSNPRFTFGGYFATNYQWQFYPDLQSGHMFWLTTMEIGPQLIAYLPFNSRWIKIVFSNSVAGLTSRPEPSTETYFYTLKFSDFIGNSHHKMKFGSLNRFNHTNLEIEMSGILSERLVLVYAFEYFGYFQKPKLGIINHSINLKWKLGK